MLLSGAQQGRELSNLARRQRAGTSLLDTLQAIGQQCC